jgi:hypothetical protein
VIDDKKLLQDLVRLQFQAKLLLERGGDGGTRRFGVCLPLQRDIIVVGEPGPVQNGPAQLLGQYPCQSYEPWSGRQSISSDSRSRLRFLSDENDWEIRFKQQRSCSKGAHPFAPSPDR